MAVLFWDASALIKGYYTEAGSRVVKELLTATSPVIQAVTVVGYVETASILRRKHNQGVLQRGEFTIARGLLERQIINDARVRLLSVGDVEYLDGLDLVDRHNLNSADAAVLVAFIAAARDFSVGEEAFVVASDRRLLRAAQAEGLQVLNPEQVALDDLPALLASLGGL